MGRIGAAVIVRHPPSPPSYRERCAVRTSAPPLLCRREPRHTLRALCEGSSLRDVA